MLPKVSLAEFKKMSTADIRAGGCVELTSDGETVGFAIIGAEQDMKHRIQAMGNLINVARPKPEELEV